MPKCNFNKVAYQLYWNHTSAWMLSCKFAHVFRTPFLENTTGWLLLLVVLDEDHVKICFCLRFYTSVFCSFWRYSREIRTEKWKNQFMMIANSSFKYASLVKTSWSICEHFVNWCTCVTFMAIFPCNYILRRKSCYCLFFFSIYQCLGHL